MTTARKLLRAAALCLTVFASTQTSSAREIYVRGLGEVFSLGVCFVGPGKCTSFLFIEGDIERLCKERPSDPIRVVGHSLGASAVMRLVHGLAECGITVEAAAFLDPMVHPYDMGKTRVLSIYSRTYRGVGENQPGAHFYRGGHISIANNRAVLAQARRFLNRGSK